MQCMYRYNCISDINYVIGSCPDIPGYLESVIHNVWKNETEICKPYHVAEKNIPFFACTSPRG